VDLALEFMRPHRDRKDVVASCHRGLWLISAAQVAQGDDWTSMPQRPAIEFNRWQEDWSVLPDQWRQNTADAVNTQPDVPVPGTAGRPGAYTGSYWQFRLDWTIDRVTTFSIEAEHFAIGYALC
jgi:hypothetical protein